MSRLTETTIMLVAPQGTGAGHSDDADDPNERIVIVIKRFV